MVLLHDASTSQWLGEDSVETKGALADWATESRGLFENEGFNVEVYDFERTSHLADNGTALRREPI